MNRPSRGPVGDPNRTPLGPRQRITRNLGRWCVVADELLRPDGTRSWDVFLEHERPDQDYPRVPAGENPHAEPWAEMARLAGLVS